MYTQYRIDSFKGIDQSRSENDLDAGFSPDAQNMDTANGDIAVAKGFVKHITAPVPGEGHVHRMYLWHDGGFDKFVVIAGRSIYHFHDDAWEEIYQYPEDITSTTFDFAESRIGNQDYLIIANGQTQLVKWPGSGEAVAFGSGLTVHTTTVASVNYNMDKATRAEYAEADGVGTYTLTMPSGWAHADGKEIAFEVPSVIGSVNSISIEIGSNTYALNFVPKWIGGDTAVVKLVNSTTAEVSETRFGAVSVVLADAIPAEWLQWAKGVGLTVAGVSYPLSETDGTTATFLDIVRTPIAAGAEASVRGGVSDIPVGFIELYYSRLFSAGDPEHPARLYWSQPPGDYRSIEDWAMDDYAEAASGGHTDVGPTSNDPIVGLTALSNQLIIHKKHGNYRLIGSNPSNFQILQVNRGVEPMANTSRISHGDVPYWLTRSGMYYFNGQQALLHPRARQIRYILRESDVGKTKGLECRDRLYFTVNRNGGEYDDSIIVFDMTEGTYMLRTGFLVSDICTNDGVIYMVNDKRTVYRFDEGDSYDGEPIEAYWNTPLTDMEAKSKNKQPVAVYFRGEGGFVRLESHVGRVTQTLKIQCPKNDVEVATLPLKNRARAFSFTLRNEGGAPFKIYGGVEIKIDVTE